MIKDSEFPTLDTRVDPMADAFAQDPNLRPRTTPRTIGTGQQFGSQRIVGDLTIANPDNTERIVIGKLLNEFGIFGCVTQNNDENNLAIRWKIIGQTFYWYDPVNANVNQMQVGKMPDGTYNVAIAKTGLDVNNAITS